MITLTRPCRGAAHTRVEAGVPVEPAAAAPHRPADRLLADYCSPEELAAELGVALRTLSRWHRLRKAPPRVRLGRKAYYHRSAVRAWVAQRSEPLK